MARRVTSEAEIIERYFAPLAAGLPGAFGLLDDCAAIHPPPGHDLVLTTDAVAAGVHFLPGDHPADVAWKALAVNVSDLAAKGAHPLCYLMSCAFPEAPEHAWLQAFAEGLAAAQEAFAITLAGGDTDRRPGPLSITIAAFGTLPTGCMVRRQGARPGDRLFLTGSVGDAALGLMLRTDPNWLAGRALAPEGQRHLLWRALRPQPRTALADVLRAHARAAMDVSDGLVKDLGRMMRASGTRAVIEAARMPLSPAARAILAEEPWRIADCLTGGEDYEILAAVAPENAGPFASLAVASGIPVAAIGEIVEGGGVCVLDGSGHPMQLEREGYDHF
jgi:thiamine-monophosphate kinase